MKNILIPTDFSSCAQNAADFALELHKGEGINCILLNTFSASDPGCDDQCYKELKEQSAQGLAEEQQRLSEKYPEVSFETISEEGSLYSINTDVIQKNNIDLVIVGTKGVKEEDEYISHSNAGEISRRLQCDMIIVPDNCTNANIKTILFTTDYQNFPESSTLIPFLEIVDKHDATPHVLHIQDEKELTVEQKREKEALVQTLEGYDYQLAEEEADRVDKGIHDYIEHNDIDMVAVVPRHNTFTDRIYHFSITQKVAEHTAIPILVISKEK